MTRGHHLLARQSQAILLRSHLTSPEVNNLARGYNFARRCATICFRPRAICFEHPGSGIEFGPTSYLLPGAPFRRRCALNLLSPLSDARIT